MIQERWRQEERELKFLKIIEKKNELTNESVRFVSNQKLQTGYLRQFPNYIFGNLLCEILI